MRTLSSRPSTPAKCRLVAGSVKEEFPRSSVSVRESYLASTLPCTGALPAAGEMPALAGAVIPPRARSDPSTRTGPEISPSHGTFCGL